MVTPQGIKHQLLTYMDAANSDKTCFSQLNQIKAMIINSSPVVLNRFSGLIYARSL